MHQHGEKMARLRVSTVLLDDLLFPNREAGIKHLILRLGPHELKLDLGETLIFEIEGTNVPDCDEVVATVHSESRRVTFEEAK